MNPLFPRQEAAGLFNHDLKSHGQSAFALSTRAAGKPKDAPLFLGVLLGSNVARRDRRGHRSRLDPREQGIALVVVLGVVAVLSVLVSDFDYSMATSYKVAESKRDRLQAEYLAKSGLNLTRLLIAKEREIRNAVGGFYRMLGLGGAPQINVWDFANEILAPFSDYRMAVEMGKEGGMDFSQMEGMVDTGGSFEIVAIPENSLINVSDPLFLNLGKDPRTSVAMQLYAMMGGYQSPESPYDPMFEDRDADGQYTNRLDIVSAIIDWWDPDQLRTIFDPGAQNSTQAGSEDDIYETFVDPYEVKNAPFDSLEELRLVRGIDDDFWATFVEPDPEDPKSRQLTVYASGKVNVNVAKPEVLLFRLCSFQSVQASSLCTNLDEMRKFVWLFNTARSILPIVFFSSTTRFIEFVEGKGKIYQTLATILGGSETGLLFAPINIPAAETSMIADSFITEAAIFTIQSTGIVGRTTVRIKTVLNRWLDWRPPKPNAGRMPGLGIFQYYRIE
ncbi:MAG: general secretion pathway protein GspK [Deltaproteobacteria bacterium]|nr:general secretion pathway protein GspK [Deltaproteobacteria bacterium]